MSLRDVHVEIGMDIADGPLAQLDRRIDDVIRSLMGIDVSAIDNAIDDVGDLSDEFGDLENNINDAADEVDNLDNTNLNNLDNEVKKADKGMGVLKKAVLGVGSALLALGIGAGLKDFTKEAIEAAAGAQAIEAQFEQVFKETQNEASKSIDSMAKDYDMLPNRIKPMFTKTTSQFKGLGLDIELAMSKAEQATRISANAAAFFDVSLEDAGGSLNSFIKGSYEGGEAIGVFANEAQMSAFAVQKGLVESTKQWANLDEATKQATRLDYAENMLTQADAMEQAVKESEAYENQMGNLKQSWQDFLAKAGAPILEQAVGVLSKLSDVISNIDPAPFMEFVSEAFNKTVDLISIVSKASGAFRELLSGDGLSTSGAMTLYQTLRIPPEILEGIKDVASAYVDTYKALFSGDVSGVADIWESLGVPPEIAEGIQGLTEVYIAGFNGAKDVVIEFVDNVIVPLMPVAQEFIGTTMGFIGSVVGGVMNTFDSLKAVISGLVENVIIPLMPVVSSIIETAFAIISPILRIAGDLFGVISAAANFMVTEIIVPLLPLAVAALEGAWVLMKPILDAIIAAFDGIADSVEWVIGKLSEVGKAMKNFDVGDKIGGAVSWVSDKVPGFEVGLGRVPYDDMPAYLHKDEAVLPKDEADALRNAGILKGDGTDPTLDFDGASYNSAAPISSGTNTSTVNAPVQIIVQGSDKPQETARSIREELEGWYSDLGAIFPVVMEG